MTKQVIGKEKAVEALASLCRDYRGTALRAVRQGGEEVFIPANPGDPQGMLEALANPEGMMQFESQGNDAHKEPCYASLNEYLSGENSDGTGHQGYLSVDVVAKVVTDFKDRSGRSVVPEIRPFNASGNLLNELTGRPNSYCL
tara:strand:+ start:164 stop:592 length:429 start_codon:yes stop_codon:yes gene_type:complete